MRLPVLLAVALLALLAPASAQAQFGLHDFEVSFTGPPPEGSEPGALGSPVTQAGAHPYQMKTSFFANTTVVKGKELPVEAIKDVLISQIEGFVGNPTALTPCSTVDFLSEDGLGHTDCADGAAVGKVEVYLGPLSNPEVIPIKGAVFLLEPPPGAPAKLGFWIAGVPVTADVGVAEEPPYEVVGASRNISEVLSFYGAELFLWGTPADPRHDEERGACIIEDTDVCPAGTATVPFLTMPRACGRTLATRWEADSWPRPGVFVSGSDPSPQIVGCDKLSFGPRIQAAATSAAAQSPSGLDFSLQVEDEGLTSPIEGALAGSDIERAVVTLPRGMTVNPSQAEGLAVCSEAQLENESAFADPGEGCPQASKIGSLEVETPLLKGEVLRGSLYVAEPYANLAEDALIAVYVVIRDRELGVFAHQAIRVEPDPLTGQLVNIAEEMPQLPISRIRLRFREGGRSPLITPPGCGRFAATAEFHPYSRGPGAATTASSSFEILSGPGATPCPAGAGFAPGFEAGTLNNAAKAFSPFAMRITRQDGEQDLSKVSATLPAGVAGILAGLSHCPEAAIATARSRTGPHGGQEELDAPSCPASSRVGRTVAGAGAGSQLTYVSGSLYLAGPYNGAPLSVVSITPAVAGPFDAGTVVVRFALSLDPRSGRVLVDGSASDAIPHILKGIPLNVRDLRAYTDRPGFTFNASGCSEREVGATLWGAGTTLAPTGDFPVPRAVPYRAAGCASLGFRPRLGITLRGGVRRGANPALRAVVTPRSRDANFAGAAVTLPRSAFLDQAHIRTICTRVQFAAGPGNGAGCPKGSIYGRARAWSPILEEPATGPVFLRSSSNELPDLVVALKGPPSAAADVELSARIDSIRGGIRARFGAIPDLPVSRFILDMQGANKGLIVNSRNLCVKPKRNRARANILGQNGRRAALRPVVRAVKCAKAKRKQAKRARHSRRTR